MKREEQIHKKAKELGQQYFPDEANIWARGNIEAEYVEKACVEMAEWLDQHPNWISVEERLPKENQSVFICNARHDYGTALYQGGEWFITREYVAINVTHWMPIVPPMKEDKK